MIGQGELPSEKLLIENLSFDASNELFGGDFRPENLAARSMR
jgi:hypothetical protein